MYDFIWLHNPLFLRSYQEKNTLITIHTTYKGYELNHVRPYIYYKIASKIEKYCLSKINNNIKFSAVSPTVQQELFKEIKIDNEVSYIPNGVNIQKYTPNNNKKEFI